MKTTVVNCEKEEYDVYIGRPSKWGNPFSNKESKYADFKVESKKEAIEKYKKWIIKQPELIDCLHEIKGKKLGCWCKSKNCHGWILAELADNGGKFKEKQKIKNIF